MTVSSLLLLFKSYLASKEAVVVVFRLKVWILSKDCSSSEVQVRWNLRFEACAEPLRELSFVLLWSNIVVWLSWLVGLPEVFPS